MYEFSENVVRPSSLMSDASKKSEGLRVNIIYVTRQKGGIGLNSDFHGVVVKEAVF